MTKLQAQFKGIKARNELKELQKAKRISELEARFKSKTKPTTSQETPARIGLSKIKKEETVPSSSSLFPKPKSKYDDDDDEDSTGSGETSVEDTKTMASHKTQLTGWGIKESTLERINFSSSKGKLDVLNKIAKFVYQVENPDGKKKFTGNLIGIEYLNLVTKAGKSVINKRPLKSKAELERIYTELIKPEPTVASSSGATGGKKK